jgi:DNA-binding transcriptional LysR family regulator
MKPQRPSPLIGVELLRSLVAVVETGSFTRAAWLLDLSQPAVSAHIRKLQEQLAVDLLDKRVPGIHLTRAGEIALAHARRILAQNDQLFDELSHVDMGDIRIGLPNELRFLLTPILTEFRATHPDRVFSVRRGKYDDLVGRFDEGQFDICVVVSGTEARDDAVFSWQQTLVWTAAESVLLPAREPVDIIAAPEDCLCREVMFDALESARMRYRVVLSAHDIEGAIEAAQAGLGFIALLPCNVQPPCRVLGAAAGGLPPLTKPYFWSVLVNRETRSDQTEQLAKMLARAAAPPGSLLA